ncbi:MAG: bifunctional glutamate N-acetyltransferase/amino-acid acetyltransferase ArgJ [Chloroflexi bacterium]|nr:MAG: bifunctional glutamate N-acetyltransferase/amino-acid acetyltransferase ArgJ [Chloroflexota bacterium]
MQELQVLEQGTVTTPRGFTAGAVHVGVRSDWEKLDVGILASDVPCAAAAASTRNRVPGASLVISRKHLASGRAQAVVANAGCANAATGKRGLDDAVRLAQLAGQKLGIDAHLVVVASTGVIGTYLPMDRMAPGIGKISLSSDGGLDFAKAIMTTDTRPKHVAVRSRDWSIGGVVKGVGMIHPNMATMLCFMTTDAAVSQPFLQSALAAAVEDSFNMIDVDSDTSPDDIAVVMANGLAQGDEIDSSDPQARLFSAALAQVCVHLAKAMVADAEGATKVIEARVEGAASREDARSAARAVISSLGVKTAVYGRDPNWGRILSAIGNSGARVEEELVKLFVATPDGGELQLFDGVPVEVDPALAKSCLVPADIRFRAHLGLGAGAATAWGSDLTENYVRLNSEYTT